MDHAFQVGQPLAQAEAVGSQRPLGQAQALQGAVGPALPLPHKVRHGFCGESSTEFLLQVEQPPALLAQGDSGNEVLRKSTLYEATHLIEGASAHEKSGAGADHGSPAVPHRFDPAVKALLIRQQPRFHPQVAHYRICIDERLRGLQQRHVGLLQKADAELQEAVLRDEVRIEHRHQLAMTATEAGIEIARLGMPPFASMPVAAAQSLGQLPHLVTAAVVEHPDSGVGIALLRAAQERSLQHCQWLAAGGHQDIHMGPPVRGLPVPMACLDVYPSIREAAPGQPQRQQTGDQQPALRQQ